MDEGVVCPFCHEGPVDKPNSFYPFWCYVLTPERPNICSACMLHRCLFVPSKPGKSGFIDASERLYVYGYYSEFDQPIHRLSFIGEVPKCRWTPVGIVSDEGVPELIRYVMTGAFQDRLYEIRVFSRVTLKNEDTELFKFCSIPAWKNQLFDRAESWKFTGPEKKEEEFIIEDMGFPYAIWKGVTDKTSASSKTIAGYTSNPTQSADQSTENDFNMDD